MTYTVYSKPNCPHCDSAKTLLASKHLEFTEVIVDIGQPKLAGKEYIPLSELKTLFPDVKSVPLILADNERVGGFVELKRHLAEAA